MLPNWISSKEVSSVASEIGVRITVEIEGLLEVPAAPNGDGEEE